LGPTLKVGRKDGSQDEAEVLAEGAAVDVPVGVVSSAVVSEAVGLVGRSGWSVGLDMMDEVGDETETEVVVPAMLVVLDITWSWLSSSSSVGMGRRVALEASIDSPKSLRCQSMKVPLFSFTIESLTMRVQVPIPDSPLIYVRKS